MLEKMLIETGACKAWDIFFKKSIGTFCSEASTEPVTPLVCLIQKNWGEKVSMIAGAALCPWCAIEISLGLTLMGAVIVE